MKILSKSEDNSEVASGSPIFPTKHKSKIPSTLAYPVKAKVISEALADVPQAQDLSIDFSYVTVASSGKKRKPVDYHPVIYVAYFVFPAQRYRPRLSNENSVNHAEWKIIVWPIPRALQRRITELLQDEALPQMHEWLVAKQDATGGQRPHGMVVCYKELADELEYNYPRP